MNSPKEEYHVMQGSMADLSTEAGRQLMEQVGAMDDGRTIHDDDPHGGRGFFDPSDRLYLVEQAQAKREKEIQEKHNELDAVRSFYQHQRLENAKAPRVVDMPALVEKASALDAPTVVVVKKKRKEPSVRPPRKHKKSRQLATALVNYASSDSDHDSTA